MTVGTRTLDSSYQIEAWHTNYAGQWFSDGFKSAGNRYYKTWNGTDGPPRVKSYETVWRWLPGARRPTQYRRVVRLPRRAKVEDHPYYCSIEQWFDRPTTYTVRDQYGVLQKTSYNTFRGEWGIGYTVKPDSVWNSNDDIALIGKLREAVAGSDFNMGVFLGEGHQTLKLIASSATRIRKSLQAIRRLDPYGAVKALGVDAGRTRGFESAARDLRRGNTPKSASNFWLELQYGWLPLLEDARNSAEMLGKLLNFPLVQTYKVRKKKKLSMYDLAPGNYIREGNDWQFAGATRGQYIARLKEVDVASLTGLTDPASVVWELVPYSFVADWFIPIGSYLAARGLASSLTGTFIKTIYREERFFCRQLKSTNKVSPTEWQIQPEWFWSKAEVTRTVSTNLSVPLPNFKPLGKVASWKHCANAVALLVQKFGSH